MNITEETIAEINRQLPPDSRLHYWGRDGIFGNAPVWILDGLTPVFHPRAISAIPDKQARARIEQQIQEANT